MTTVSQTSSTTSVALSTDTATVTTSADGVTVSTDSEVSAVNGRTGAVTGLAERDASNISGAYIDNWQDALGVNPTPSAYVALDVNDTEVETALADIDGILYRGPTPPGMWGAALIRWRAAMADRANRVVNAVVLGDSITGGWVAGTRAGGYVQVMADALCAAIGQPTGHARYLPAAKTYGDSTVYVYGSPWTHSGTSYTVNEQFGLGRLGTYMPTAGANYVETTQYCDRVTVLYPRATLAGNLQVWIDGVLTTTLSEAGAYRSSLGWTSAALTPGNHTVRLVPTTLACNVEGVYFHAGDASAGLRVWNSGKPAASTLHFYADVGGVSWCDGFADTIPPDLVIIELGSNDVYWPWATPAVTQSNLEDTVDLINANCVAGSEPSIVFVVPPRNSFESLDSDWLTKIRRPIWRTAQQYPNQCAVFDAWALLGQDATTASLFYSDNTHPNALGHRVLGRALAQWLLAEVPLAAGIDGGSA